MSPIVWYFKSEIRLIEFQIRDTGNRRDLIMRYPEIDSLKQAIKGKGLRLSVAPREPRFDSISYRHVVLLAEGESWRIPAEDEDRNIEDANSIWLLDRVLRECYWYETSPDFLVWAKDLELNASLDVTREVYFELRAAAPPLRSFLGPDVQCISDYDASLDTGVMRALRRCSLDME